MSRRKIARVIHLILLFSLGLPGSASGGDVAEHEELLNNAAQVIGALYEHQQWEGMRNILGTARGVYISGKARRASFIAGFEHTEGVLLRRQGRVWSDPVLMKTSQLSLGIQAGVVASDMLMMLMTDGAVTQLSQGLSKAAGSGGFTLGSLGINVAGGGSVKSGFEVLIVETTAGLYLGGGGGKLDMDDLVDVNREAYGEGYDVSAILDATGAQLESAETLRRQLADMTEQSLDN